MELGGSTVVNKPRWILFLGNASSSGKRVKCQIRHKLCNIFFSKQLRSNLCHPESLTRCDICPTNASCCTSCWKKIHRKKCEMSKGINFFFLIGKRKRIFMTQSLHTFVLVCSHTFWLSHHVSDIHPNWFLYTTLRQLNDKRDETAFFFVPVKKSTDIAWEVMAIRKTK